MHAKDCNATLSAGAAQVGKTESFGAASNSMPLLCLELGTALSEIRRDSAVPSSVSGIGAWPIACTCAGKEKGLVPEGGLVPQERKRRKGKKETRGRPTTANLGATTPRLRAGWTGMLDGTSRPTNPEYEPDGIHK